MTAGELFYAAIITVVLGVAAIILDGLLEKWQLYIRQKRYERIQKDMKRAFNSKKK